MNVKSTPPELLWVAAGGAIGAVLRYGTGHLLESTINSDQAILFTNTAFENILGSFAIGLAYTILASRTGKNHQMSLFLLTGIIGSYTTYSGFMVENLMFLQSEPALLVVYLMFQVLTGVLAAFVGIYLGKKWIRYLSRNCKA